MKRREFLHRSASGIGMLAALRHPKREPDLRRHSSVDLVLRRGTIFDGSGGPPFRADVAVEGDRIAAVGPSLRIQGATELDVSGLAVAPGFIDIHSHTDLSLLYHPYADSKVYQGVTTEVAGQDGGSVGPWTDEVAASRDERFRERFGVPLGFSDIGGFLTRIEAARPSVNVATMVGAGTVRGAVVGSDDRAAAADELAQMVQHVRDALDAGACGLSSGLEYVPGAFASTDELVSLAEPLRERGLPYASHMRNEDDRLLGAIEEAIAVGRRAGVSVQISHLKALGRRNWWKSSVAIGAIEAARESGVDVMFDRYPYVAYSTGLVSLFPVWAREGGASALIERLDDPVLASAVERAVHEKIDLLGDWDAVQITSTEDDSLTWARGERLGALAAGRGTEPYEMLCELVRADEGRSGMVGFGMSEENTERFLAHPLGIICSDGGARAVTGPLSEGTPHPRTYGTFPRVLGHYVRERNTMSLEAAIRKMTALPAARLRFGDRGLLRSGYAADIVVFDPTRIRDRATFAAPHQYATGVEHVFVNGVFALRDGALTRSRSGRVIRPS